MPSGLVGCFLLIKSLTVFCISCWTRVVAVVAAHVLFLGMWIFMMGRSGTLKLPVVYFWESRGQLLRHHLCL